MCNDELISTEYEELRKFNDIRTMNTLLSPTFSLIGVLTHGGVIKLKTLNG